MNEKNRQGWKGTQNLLNSSHYTPVVGNLPLLQPSLCLQGDIVAIKESGIYPYVKFIVINYHPDTVEMYST